LGYATRNHNNGVLIARSDFFYKAMGFKTALLGNGTAVDDGDFWFFRREFKTFVFELFFQ
jgi:hypothetical protein